jgi:hypothetical protein
MNSQELRVITAVAILTGTLVIGLDHLSTQPIANTVKLAQSNAAVSGNQGSGTGSGNAGGTALSGEIDPRDNSRMDTRQGLGFSGPGGGVSRAGSPSALQLGPADYDSRRDTSRLDSRQNVAPAAVPSAKDEVR